MSTDPWNERPSRGLWSDQVETEEAQKGGQLDAASFPTLGQASKTRMKKKGNQPMSLSQFMTQDSDTTNTFHQSRPARPQTNTEILMSLPKQPKQRDPNEEPQQRWGGKSEHSTSSNDSNSASFLLSFLKGGGFVRDERMRRVPQRDEEFMPSRADESSDWGTDKRSTFPSQGNPRNYDRPHSRGSSRGYDDGGDSWSANRYHSGGGGGGGHRSSGFGNFHDHDRDRRQGYGFHSGPGTGSYSTNRWQDDRWSQPTPHQSTNSERKRLVIDKRTKPLDPNQGQETIRPKQKSNPFGEARPREEVLKERGVDVASSDVFSSRSDICSEQDFKSQSGSPGGSYRGSTVSGTDTLDHHSMTRKSKPRSEDPFGGARPREDVLNER
eukprot:g3647.t2